MKKNRRPNAVYAPVYYRAFHCIADRCRHSCCVDWEIPIDEKTLEKYRGMAGVMDTVTVCEGSACFSLLEDGRCPHLNDEGLCRIILAHGEDALSDICRHHPRYCHDMGGGRREVGLGLVCEEACRLILACEEPFSLEELQESDAYATAVAAMDKELRGYDPLPARDAILARINAHAGNYDTLRTSLGTEFGLRALPTPAEWVDRFLSLEILDADWEAALQAAKKQAPSLSGERSMSGEVSDPYFIRLLAYFVHRHVSVAQSANDLRARLAFSVLSTDMIRHLFACAATQTLDTLMELARRYSAEIEYSEDNTDELIFALMCGL